MAHPWLVLSGIALVALLFVLVPVMTAAYVRFRTTRAFRCPLAGIGVDVALDNRHAALTAAFGRPALRISRCTLWPRRTWCAQACLGSGAVPDTEGAAWRVP